MQNESQHNQKQESIEFPGDIPSVDILGIKIHNIALEKAVSVLKDMAISGKSHHAVTVNPEFVMLAKQDNKFKKVLLDADLALPDGIGIVMAARILGRPISERVAGVDVVLMLARIARDYGLSIFLLGAAPGIAEKTASILKAENPGLKIAGTYAGSPSLEEEDNICSIIRRANPHILLVAYGPPRQDLWIARTRPKLQVPVAIGVGGTFDFISGIAVRAPIWVRKLGFEWLHRLIKEPRRWRRMLTLPLFAIQVLKQGLQRALTSSKSDIR